MGLLYLYLYLMHPLFKFQSSASHFEHIILAPEGYYLIWLHHLRNCEVKEWSEEAKISSMLQQGELHVHTSKVFGNAGVEKAVSRQ